MILFNDNNILYSIFLYSNRCAGELKKSEPTEDEHYIISKALQTCKYCELLPQDQKMFKQILDRVSMLTLHHALHHEHYPEHLKNLKIKCEYFTDVQQMPT